MTLSRRALIKGLALTGISSATATATYGIAYSRHQIGVTRASLTVAGLPAALHGLRIGLLTDIHHSAMVPATDVTRAVDLVMAERPDLVVLGGDYVTDGDRAFTEPVAELLARLHAPRGVFAILGNHDDERAVPEALKRRGIEVLKDARTQLDIGGTPLGLVGVRFWTRGIAEIAPILEGARGTTLLLAHDPRRLAEASALKIPAVLSGHTHGGQVVLPGIGPLVRRRFPVLDGLGAQGTSTIFVSRGVGTVYVPIRINCPPEVALLTLVGVTPPARSDGLQDATPPPARG